MFRKRPVNQRLYFKKILKMSVLGVFILNICNVYASEASLDEQLLSAASRGNTAEVKELLRRGADVNTIDDDRGIPVLVRAIEFGNDEVAKVLIEAGANLDASGRGWYTPLLLAIQQKKQELAKLLLHRGADADAGFDFMGETALTLASKLGFYDIVRMLLDQGADRDRINEPGGENDMTALMYAAKEGHQDIVQLLLDSGADVDVVDLRGWTPLMHAVFQVWKQGSSSELSVAFLIVNALLASGANPNIIGRNNETALTLIWCQRTKVSVNMEEVIMALFKAGASPDLGTSNPYSMDRGINTLWFCLVDPLSIATDDTRYISLWKAAINASSKNGRTIFLELAQEILESEEEARSTEEHEYRKYRFETIFEKLLRERFVVPPTEEEMTQAGLSNEAKSFMRSQISAYFEFLAKEVAPVAKELAHTRLPDDIIISVLVQKYGPSIEHEDVLPHIEEALHRASIERVLKGQDKKMIRRQEEKKREEAYLRGKPRPGEFELE